MCGGGRLMPRLKLSSTTTASLPSCIGLYMNEHYKRLVTCMSSPSSSLSLSSFRKTCISPRSVWPLCRIIYVVCSLYVVCKRTTKSLPCTRTRWLAFGPFMVVWSCVSIHFIRYREIILYVARWFQTADRAPTPNNCAKHARPSPQTLFRHH